MPRRALFHPTFGSRPERIVGRDPEIQSILHGLEEPFGSRDRCTLMLGQRGMGKTALLLELEERASSLDYVVARVSHNESMLDEIIELVQRHGAQFVKDRKNPVKGFSAGALGFTFGLTFSDETRRNFGFRTKLTMLCERLEEAGKGVLILVDEAKTSPDMRQLATTYQHLVGEERNVAICMAGLPHAVSSVLNDDVLTFLNRATKMRLGPIPVPEIRAYYESAFRQLGISCSDELLAKAAEDTRGFPYLMQLIGYYAQRLASESGAIDESVLAKAEDSARTDLAESVFQPILAQLSRRDIDVLAAMSADDGETRTSDLLDRLGVDDSYLQRYRARLIEAGVVESPRRGSLDFAVPLLREHLREMRA